MAEWILAIAMWCSLNGSTYGIVSSGRDAARETFREELARKETCQKKNITVFRK